MGRASWFLSGVTEGSRIGDLEASHVRLRLGPRTTQQSAAKQVFTRLVAPTFTKVTFGLCPANYRCHDRLYLVRDQQGILTGVFGPSLNGLSSDSIVLMGEIDEKAGLAALRRMFK